jgi:hypothetical protein
MNSFLVGPGALVSLRGLFPSIFGLVSNVLLSCLSCLHNTNGGEICQSKPAQLTMDNVCLLSINVDATFSSASCHGDGVSAQV